MSADGEIDIAVRAEGADEAAEELAQAGDTGPSVSGGDGGGGGTLSRAAAGGGGAVAGLLAGLSTAVLAAVAALGALIGLVAIMPGMLDFLKGILKVLQAFLAPISVMLMRLLTPVLRKLVQLLPGWFNFIDTLPGKIDNVVEWIRSLPGRIWSFISTLPALWVATLISAASWLAEGASNIGSAVWGAIKSGASWLTNGAVSIAKSVWNLIKQGFDRLIQFIRRLPQMIGQRIAEVVPGLDNVPGGDTAENLVESGQEFLNDPAGETGDTIVNIGGGLETFVDNVDKETGLDLT